MEIKTTPFEDFAKRYEMVIALDLGELRSGFAYASFKDGIVNTCNDCKEQPFPMAKVPTCMAYPLNNPTKPEWGWQARNNFVLNPDKYKFRTLFKGWKARLTELLNRPQDENKQKELAETGKMLTDFLSALKLKALNHIFDERGLSRSEKILWRIAVPATFLRSEAKNILLKALVEANILIEPDENALVSETEAAIVFAAVATHPELLKPNNTIMVVDGGANDVRIHTYRVQFNGSLKLTAEVSSNETDYKCGSVYIDEAFIDTLTGLLGAKNLVSFEKLYTNSFLTLMKDWEKTKAGKVDLRVLSNFISQNNWGMQDRISQTSFEDLVSQRLDKINQNVTAFILENIHKRSIPVNYILFTGGLFEINYTSLTARSTVNFILPNVKSIADVVRASMLENTDYNKANILTPTPVSEMVLQGATLFGINPAIIGYGVGGVLQKAQVLVKGGRFEMGDLFNDSLPTFEKPVHKVTLDDFYMGACCVTFEEYDAFCVATKRKKPDDLWGRGKMPAVGINWYDAVEYCNWLSLIDGLQEVYTIKEDLQVIANFTANGYRLPTEAEWEYAAREGGKKVRFGNGQNTLRATEANFDANKDYKQPYSEVGEYRGRTVAVDSFAPNALGLYNMSGNVWEWCQDWFDSDYYKNSPRENPRGPENGSIRVLRGGCWGSFPQGCRVACRFGNSPAPRFIGYGFRLAFVPQLHG